MDGFFIELTIAGECDCLERSLTCCPRKTSALLYSGEELKAFLEAYPHMKISRDSRLGDPMQAKIVPKCEIERLYPPQS
jgi:hypothetical protein